MQKINGRRMFIDKKIFEYLTFDGIAPSVQIIYIRYCLSHRYSYNKLNSFFSDVDRKLLVTIVHDSKLQASFRLLTQTTILQLSYFISHSFKSRVFNISKYS